jgi:DNA-binding transcriptional MerR regulator
MKATRVSFTVKQLAVMAGVSVRTLHYYDQIGLLRPQSYGENGYRYYAQEDLLRLQQILYFRELDFSLDQIKSIMERPDFDLLTALESHRRALRVRVTRLNTLIDTVDRTMQHLRGEITMSKKDFYTGFDEEQQKKYAEEAVRRWGEPAAASQKRWESLTRDEKNDILARMNEITLGISGNMDKGPESPEVQQWIDRWYQHINTYFYDCSLEIFESLGRMYNEDPAFRATYEKVRPGLAAFMEKAMLHYVKSQR